MKVKNHTDFACFEYESSESDIYELGDIVINYANEIGVIIQVYNRYDYRTDMFGNCSITEIRSAHSFDISKYRPELNNHLNN